MPKKTIVSVVILNYNGSKYLEETILSILELNYPALEIIIVDNGSVDGSVDLIKKYENIKIVYNNTNLGYSKGKNVGLKLANGEYILCLDEDILIKDKNIIQKLLCEYSSRTGFLQVPLVDKGEEKTFYYGTYYSIYGLNMHRKSIDIRKIMNRGKIRICGPTGGFFFVSKENLYKIGFFDEIQDFHLDDVDIGPRSCILGFENFLVTSAYCEHLGVGKTKKIEDYARRFRLVFSGHGRAMIKNFNLKNLIVRFPVFFIFQFIKALKFSIAKRSTLVFYSFLLSVTSFFKNLNSSLKERHRIQIKRVIKSDVFLNIKPPNF